MWERASSGRRSERLGERRRLRRRVSRIFFCTLLLLLLAASIYGLQQPGVRISRVTIIGSDDSFSAYATSAMQGRYLGLIPRDSIIFFPADQIRASILASHQDIAAISISRSSFTSLSIKIDNRVPIARWCGLSPTPLEDEYCYVFDANGFIFSADATTDSTSSPQATQTINAFALYAPLAGDTLEPLRATIADADKIPSAFDFARQLTTLGSPANKVVIHDNEVDVYVKSGTRITYVLGNEQNAYTNLISARGNFNIADGSVDYVDLRFDGKVYVKKRADSSRQ